VIGQPVTNFSTYAAVPDYSAGYAAQTVAADTFAAPAAAAPAPSPETAFAQAPVVNDTTTTTAANVDEITAADFAGQGEANFKAGKYQAAARDFRHALVDDPTNAGVLMLLGQTAFAMGQYNEAAGATELAMKLLPDDKWGSVITNYTQLYGKAQDYTDQLRAVEKARDQKPEEPAVRFLLGFHYCYLGHTKEALAELDKAIQLQPQDPFARQLRNMTASKLGLPAVEAPAGSAPAGTPPAGTPSGGPVPRGVPSQERPGAGEQSGPTIPQILPAVGTPA
jgi:tetratricopeptide (TPR) repeat protein